MQATSCRMRPGAYRSFTFRLPAHLPTAHIAVAVSRGCVSLFASNASNKPQPHACQWQRSSVRAFAHVTGRHSNHGPADLQIG